MFYLFKVQLGSKFKHCKEISRYPHTKNSRLPQERNKGLQSALHTVRDSASCVFCLTQLAALCPAFRAEAAHAVCPEHAHAYKTIICDQRLPFPANSHQQPPLRSTNATADADLYILSIYKCIQYVLLEL